ncbi:roadblock/LC7 domain-containing protein [Streptantibioticus rubrisoli]|jgi:predicted regulator of Ras-like GTPase activity (Roadblock/LC7/MglB family)|uniref:Roadblock/LC7 domain-containing protein n=1 Tax=Streptantibioticus rubrisoli TaxID=1387313 RepID=A0ABT1PAR5_9ACTN|nr:roadblock/LC7 domain-containing protein [Streptantibioticus rubrisoli]MCQ4041338.1 roadblock/LC7 domain-containing protein [Streptantibioticus rubrisoli]
MTATDHNRGLDWLLEDLVARTSEVRQAVLLSSDGLPTASSQGLARADIEHLAALCSGFNSLAKAVGEQFRAGGMRQTMVMLEDAYLFVTPAGAGSCLAVLCDAGTDVGQLGYEMSLLVKRAGRHLGTPPRSDAAG